MGWAHTTDVGFHRVQGSATAHQRARCADGAYQVVDLSLGLLPYLDGRVLVVGQVVGCVGKLVGHVVFVGVLGHHAAGEAYGSIGALVGGREDDLGAVRADDLAPLDRAAELITISTGNPSTIPAMASPMPVLPDVGSMMVLPGDSPLLSAASTMRTAMRSLMLPVGLKPSSLAYMFTRGLGHRAFIFTIGVEPIVERMFFFTMAVAVLDSQNY